MALLSCTRSGVSGPSAATAPLAPCAEIVPGPFDSSSPTKVWKTNRWEGVEAASPKRAAQATSVSERAARISAFVIPQNRSGSRRSAGTVAPIMVPIRRTHHGRPSTVNRETRLRVSGPQARVVAAASTVSAVG